MNTDWAVERLEELAAHDDPECAHFEADTVLTLLVPKKVADAYSKVHRSFPQIDREEEEW